MNNGNLKKAVSVFLSLTLALIALILSVSAYYFSFSWFSVNKEVKGNGLNVNVKDVNDFTIEKITVYRYNEFRTAVEEKEVQKDQKITLSLWTYDKVFTARNSTNAIVIKIDLANVTAGSILYLDFSCADGTPELDNLSDVVAYKVCVADKNLGVAPKDVYDRARGALSNTPEYAFRSGVVTGGTATKIIQTESHTLTWEEGKSLYVMLDYSDALTSDVPNDFTTQEYTFSGEHGDLTSITICKKQGV